ncbi:hypothetical protein AHAS_Ahas01G0066800 [Arachis hypogaea]
MMSKSNSVRKHVLEKSKSVKETRYNNHNYNNNNKNNNHKALLSQSFFPKFLKKVYPIGLQKSNSSLSLSSISLSLSQNSNDSLSQADDSVTNTTPLDEKISLALRLISPQTTSHEVLRDDEVNINNSLPKIVHHQQQPSSLTILLNNDDDEPGELRRCNWITKNSDKVYIEFHDECWGVPAYDDNKLFELLALCGLLIDYNWTEILKRKETLREVFAEFDPNIVAKMEEKEIMDIISNKALSLADSRIMCIVDNAKCIMKANEFIVMALEAGAFESIHPSRFICFTIPNPSCSDSLLRVAVLDSHIQPADDSPQVGGMLVPDGREADWIFSTKSGHSQLLYSSQGISRLILVGNQPKEGDCTSNIYHRPLECSLHQQGFEVWSKPLLLALSPRSLFKNGIPEIALLNYEDNLISSVVIHRCVGYLVGEMLVEDVEIEMESENGVHHSSLKREFRRRLRFKRMPNLIQTEIHIVPETDHSCDGVSIKDVEFMLDHRVLVHPYLAPMVASLSLISENIARQIQDGFKPKALCLGVGGGALLTFLTTQLGFEVTGVENDGEVLSVAKHYFGLEADESIRVVIGDGIEFTKKIADHKKMYNGSSFASSEHNDFDHFLDAKISHNFDVVMVDLDSRDIRNGTSSPPLEFVRRDVLLAAKSILSENGILVINVIPLSKSFYESLENHLHEVFCELHKIDVRNGENFVLIAAVSPQISPVSDHCDSFLMQLKSVIPESWINSISKI